MDILQYIFLLHFVSLRTSPPASGTSQPPDNLNPSGPREGIPVYDGSNEVHIVIDLPYTPQFSSNGDLMEDSKKDPELEEHQLDHDYESAKIGASDNSFNSGRELGDMFGLDYNLSRDHQIDLYYMLTSEIDYFLSPHVYSIASWIDEFCTGYNIAYSQIGLSDCVDQSHLLLGM